MKKILIVLPCFVFAVNFSQIEQSITNSLQYKIAKKKIEIYKKRLKIAKSKNYGSLDLSYKAVYFLDQPIMKSNTPTPVAVASDGVHLIYENISYEMDVSNKEHFSAKITYSYPLFTGFAISNNIDKSKIELIKSKLELQNIKRELILNSAKLYAKIYTLKATITALIQAKKALMDAQEQALCLYKEGLINKSQLYAIKAKYYATLAHIRQIKAQKNSLLFYLSYLLNKKITKIDGLEDVDISNNPNLLNRADIKALREGLKVGDKNIELAKSKNYPQVGLEVGVSKESDDFSFTKNDYQNLNQAYVAIGVKYNLFDASATKNSIEIAKIAKISNIIFYQNYINKVQAQYNCDIQTLNALKFELQAIKEELKARQSYYEYIKTKFNEGLVDVVDLNSAIAKLSESKAKKESIKAEIFFVKMKIKLDS